MAGGIDGIALAAIGAGSLFLFAGIKGASVLTTLQQVIRGQNPAGAGSTTAAAAGTAAGSTAPPAAGSAATYTAAQLAQLWQQAGGSAATAHNAACHAMQESSGRPDATSNNPDGGTNVGLWQLDTPGGVGAGYSVEQLMNPMLNAQITVMATRNGTDWSDWSTPGC